MGYLNYIPIYHVLEPMHHINSSQMSNFDIWNQEMQILGLPTTCHTSLKIAYIIFLAEIYLFSNIYATLHTSINFVTGAKLSKISIVLYDFSHHGIYVPQTFQVMVTLQPRCQKGTLTSELVNKQSNKQNKHFFTSETSRQITTDLISKSNSSQMTLVSSFPILSILLMVTEGMSFGAHTQKELLCRRHDSEFWMWRLKVGSYLSITSCCNSTKSITFRVNSIYCDTAMQSRFNHCVVSVSAVTQRMYTT